MKILKFGGTSVGSAESINALLDILKQGYEQGEKPIVVLSAMSGITNLLTKMAEEAEQGISFGPALKELESRHFTVVKQLIQIKNQNPVFTQLKIYLNELEDLLQGVLNLRELSSQSKDLIVSYGERCSAFLVSKIAAQYFPESLFVEASSLIKTDSNFGNARVDLQQSELLIRQFVQENPGKFLFVTGFIASNVNGRITTLGRGGSDYTAAIFGAALQAEAIEIWTDVDGMLTADPRMVKKAFPLPILSYTEAMELSYFGAKVIYPPTMIPAFMKKVPIVIRNTFNPSFPGTIIQYDSGRTSYPIKGISSINAISVINVSGSGMIGKAGFSGRLFSLLAHEQINIVLITQSSSEHSITFAVHPADALRAKYLIETEFELELLAKKLEPPVIENELSVLAIVGENMKQTPGMSGRLFHALGRNGINVRAIAQGSSEYNISVIISQADLSKALNAVHDAFFTALKKTLHVFNLGTGNIGSTLFRQLLEQEAFLRDNNDIQVKVVGMSNSRKMLFDVEGISLTSWQTELDSKGETASLETFISRMQQLNLPNCIFVDNTASEEPTKHYLKIFESNISVVTCNKIANSSSYAQYKQLRDTARRHGVDFFYETNVGAGLPIVRTLKDLMTSGDRIIRIEAILSGTISYIFNNFIGDASFHDVVKKAQALGYTEPDPRDDLRGTDFMRKMLILARDSGLAIEAKDVDLGAILPKACLDAASVEDFYLELQKEAAYFDTLKEKAQRENRAIRYIGKLQDGKVSIALELVDEKHPFFNLSGSDNVISFTTERYKERPLVVKGPGAGSEVTAGGVFADLMNAGA
ncbi:MULTISPECIES: bifunctional aspartate kinase/homoserine dehydrogenase I [Olivibacter]|uniref:Bifunctional aspartate kinase/homoserine dehydrogenase I n=1 Tax=Olivibacter jilunii TaxID=985016 RepID=A0ABW6B637_9SPHI|nr:bifunctional aspartate kinase/homoserine dehydrogenase I [Olivibacter sp. UJ_SKK_5.1]MDX3912288.1 bifunctional aspartate kinase/homoserine dehydrogenase I [Pseudosphingobacterium sp.]